MRKCLSIILMLVMMIYISNFSVIADYVIGQENRGDTIFQREEASVPFDVSVIYRASRYAVDVEYSDMNINVKSAIWNVNTYEYDVVMEDDTPEITVKVINHSDLPIKAQIDFVPTDLDLQFTQTCTVKTDKLGAFQVPAVQAQDAMKVTTTIAISPKNGLTWQKYINRVIAEGVPPNGKTIVGEVILSVSKE